MELFEIYYLQTNLICIALILFLCIDYCREVVFSNGKRYFLAEMGEIILYCICDIVAAVCKYRTFPGVRTVLYIANSLYIAMPLIIAVTWGIFTKIRTERFGVEKSIVAQVFRIILLVAFFLTLTSPFTHFAFYLDESNKYVRALGAYTVPLLCYSYLIFESIRVYRLGQSLEFIEGKREFRSLCYYTVPAVICSVIQIVVYGLTLAQVGFTFGVLIVYLKIQENRISRDSLTGLSNRREFERQLDHFTKSSDKLFVSIIDIDKFKQINDEYGHNEGDVALKAVAEVLEKAANSVNQGKDEFLVFRYGGDEFAIMSRNYTGSSEECLKIAITRELAYINGARLHPYELSLSIGFAMGKIGGDNKASSLIQSADQAMYKAKNSKS